MKKLQQICCITLIVLGSLTESIADENSQTPQQLGCSKQMLRTFFPAPIVRSVLNQRNIPPDKMDAITAELSNIDQQVNVSVETKISKLNLNPLLNNADREQASNIFRSTLYDAFAQVLMKNGIDNPEEIRTYFDEIHKQKSKLFIECIQKEQR